jgi:hypothetical protein
MVKRLLKNKKAAMELSMSTIVILVLAMSMLILGLVLVRTIFTGAKYNVDDINSKVKDQISKLFSEDQEMVIYLANGQVDIKQNEQWGVAFCVKNLKQDSSDNKFPYTVSVNEISGSCTGIDETKAMSFIVLGKEDILGATPGEVACDRIRFLIPKGTPLCMIRYGISIKNNGNDYTFGSFDVQIKA